MWSHLSKSFAANVVPGTIPDLLSRDAEDETKAPSTTIKVGNRYRNPLISRDSLYRFVEEKEQHLDKGMDDLMDWIDEEEWDSDSLIQDMQCHVDCLPNKSNLYEIFSQQQREDIFKQLYVKFVNIPCILMYSGGIDSTTLLKDLRDIGRKILPLYVITGGPTSRHDMDSKAATAKELATEYGLTLETWDLSGFAKKHNPDRICIGVGKKCIPFGGATMYSALAGLAIYRKIKEVYIAYHKEDAKKAIMYGPEFLKQTNALIKLAHPNDGVGFIAPFHDMTKNEVMAKGKELGVPFSSTWSCSKATFMNRKQCGGCISCLERKLNFAYHGITNLTKYQEK